MQCTCVPEIEPAINYASPILACASGLKYQVVLKFLTVTHRFIKGRNWHASPENFDVYILEEPTCMSSVFQSILKGKCWKYM